MSPKKIQIAARAAYLVEQSSVDNAQFLWTYEITIANQSEEIVQLLNRTWRITDMLGRVEEVRGPGVVGLQPVIKPDKTFAYSSFCQLTTPQGTMEGTYEFQTLDEEHFFVDVPKFILSSPESISSALRSKLH